MPSRRALLRTCGVGLSLGLGGCLSSGGGSPATSGTTRPTSEDATRPTTSDDAIRPPDATSETDRPASDTSATTVAPPPEVREVDPTSVADRGLPVGPDVESDAEEPFLAFAVGDRDGVANPDNDLAHHFWVWNDTDAPRTVEVALSTGGTTLIDDAFEIPARKPLGVELREPRTYEWAVRTDDRGKAEDVPRSQFDCNHSATDVIVRDAEIDVTTITTEMWCTTTASESA